MRELSYSTAINETLSQLLTKYQEVFLIGQGVTSPWYVGSTTIGLIERFGKHRIIDTPVSENAVTGVAIGSALAGMKPILVHPRLDFMFLALDQIANHAGNWYYMFGGQLNTPVTIWGIINRGGEQAAQHSQAIQAIFSHLPGLKVVAPSTPHDVKGLLVASICDGNPVIFIDDRWLYNISGPVPKDLFTIPIGEGVIRRKGSDVTVVSSSFLMHESLKAADLLQKDNIDAEVIDLRSIKPLDINLIKRSISKTGRLVIVDGAWQFCGLSAEIAAEVSESECFRKLESPIKRVTLPNCPAPASSALEKIYYPNFHTIADSVRMTI